MFQNIRNNNKMILQRPFPLKIKKNAQISFEFLFLIAAGFVIAMVFIVSAGIQLKDLNSEKEFTAISDLGYSIQTELYLAAQVEPGYQRTFFIPYDVDGIDFSLNITSDRLVLVSEHYEHVFSVPSLTGQPRNGYNSIRNVDNSVHLN